MSKNYEMQDDFRHFGEWKKLLKFLSIFAETDQYDHLNYTRPSGTRKPHYQRMSSALKLPLDGDENANKSNQELDPEI